MLLIARCLCEGFVKDRNQYRHLREWLARATHNGEASRECLSRHEATLSLLHLQSGGVGLLLFSGLLTILCQVNASGGLLPSVVSGEHHRQRPLCGTEAIELTRLHRQEPMITLILFPDHQQRECPAAARAVKDLSLLRHSGKEGNLAHEPFIGRAVEVEWVAHVRHHLTPVVCRLDF